MAFHGTKHLACRWRMHCMCYIFDFTSVIQIVPKTNEHFIFCVSLETDGDFFGSSIITESHFSFNRTTQVRFATGIPRVGICHTITVPSDTAPVQGKGRNWTLIHAVSWIPAVILWDANNQNTTNVHATCILFHNLDIWWFPLPLWVSFHSRQNIFK